MYGSYGGAIFAMAIGAILNWAVRDTVSGLAIGTVGVILLLAGLAWLVLSLAFDFNERRTPEAAEPDPHVRVW